MWELLGFYFIFWLVVWSAMILGWFGVKTGWSRVNVSQLAMTFDGSSLKCCGQAWFMYIIDGLIFKMHWPRLI
jgi:hypothetical protein